MKRMPDLRYAWGLIFVFAFTSCSSGPIGADGVGSGGSVSPGGDDSVADVTDGVGDPSDSPTAAGAVRARVRNESTARADVTVRFLRGTSVVHLAFVRVLSGTATTVSCIESAEQVELSGVDERGRALAEAVFRFGVDFDYSVPAEYVVTDEASPPAPEHPGPVDRPSVTPRVTLLEPAVALEVALGATFTARWIDETGSSSSLVTVYLQPIGQASDAAPLAAGPAVGAILDGINDTLRVVVQDVEPGLYRVLAQLVDGDQTVTSIAPGTVRVVVDPTNAAPVLDIRAPHTLVALKNTEALNVEWDDSDPDDNATVTFELSSVGPTGSVTVVFRLGPPIAEDPDGGAGDRAILPLTGVSPGLYDLVGTIDDGQLLGTTRVQRVVQVLPSPANAAPTLRILEPAMDRDVEQGATLLVRWEDEDPDNDARIALLLDPDPAGTSIDGNELLLAASLGEDADGGGDRILLGIPQDTEVGVYRLLGVISDGLVESLVSATGRVHVIPRPTPGGDDNANGNDNTPDNTDDNGNLNDNGDSGGIITPPPRSPPISVTPLEGVDGDLTVVDGELAEVQVGEEVIRNVNAFTRIFLSNLAYGGFLRVDATPEGFDPADVDPRAFTAPVNTQVVPNRTWPRKFDVEVETTIDGQTTLTVVDRPIWIVQKVEVVASGVVGATCIPVTLASSTPIELRIEWYGGGVLDVGAQADVEFWLVREGSVPPAGVEDAAHRVVALTPASPRYSQIMLIDILDVLRSGFEPTAAEPGQLLGSAPALEVGTYRLTAILDPLGVDPMITGPFFQAISVCDPNRPTGPGR